MTLAAFLAVSCGAPEAEWLADLAPAALERDAGAPDAEPAAADPGGISGPLDRLCLWDACGGPLPDRQAPAKDPTPCR